MTGPSAAVAAAIAARQKEVPQVKLDGIRAKAREAKELELFIDDLKEQTKQANKRLYEIKSKELVDLMLAAGVNGVDVAAQGNLPAFEAKLQPYYKAQIPSDAPEAERVAAFKALEESGNGDLIKTTVTVDFPREARAAVAAFVKQLPKNITHTVEASVHWGTLTKWLRETVESGHLPEFMDLIHAEVGKMVNLKEKK